MLIRPELPMLPLLPVAVMLSLLGTCAMVQQLISPLGILATQCRRRYDTLRVYSVLSCDGGGLRGTYLRTLRTGTYG